MDQQGKTLGDLKKFDPVYYLKVYSTGSLFFHIFTVKDIVEFDSVYDHCRVIEIRTFCGFSIRFHKQYQTERKVLGYYSDIAYFFDDINLNLRKVKRDMKSLRCSLPKRIHAMNKLKDFLQRIKKLTLQNKIYHKRLNLMTNIYDGLQIFEENV